MADPQDQPDATPTPGPHPATEPPLSTPPADTAPPAPAPATEVANEPPKPAMEAEKPAKKAPAKKAAAKKAAAKPAKKAAPAKAAKKAAAKKAPAKKAPAKKVAALAPDTNGHLAAGAKDAAAHAKSTVEAARNPLPAQAAAEVTHRSPLPFAVAIAISLLAVLVIRRLRSDDD